MYFNNISRDGDGVTLRWCDTFCDPNSSPKYSASYVSNDDAFVPEFSSLGISFVQSIDSGIKSVSTFSVL